VKPNQWSNHGPHQYACSTQGSSPVKIKHNSISRFSRTSRHFGRLTIDQIRVIGNRRIPKETILARLFTHPGDVYDPISIERDFNSLWNTGYFRKPAHRARRHGKGHHPGHLREGKADDPRDQLQGAELGLAVRRSGPLQEGKGRLSRREPVRPGQDQARETVLKELLAEHGHQFATVKTGQSRHSAGVGAGELQHQGRPHGQGGQHQVHRQRALSGLMLRRAMKNLKPIGIPYSIFFEDLFPQTFDASKLEEDTERVRQAYRDKGYANAASRSRRRRSATRAA
jgi:outer membrane protein insertion porin family